MSKKILAGTTMLMHPIIFDCLNVCLILGSFQQASRVSLFGNRYYILKLDYLWLQITPERQGSRVTLNGEP